MVGQGRLGVYVISAASGGLPNQEVTFAKIAKQQGYKTALIGETKSSSFTVLTLQLTLVAESLLVIYW